MRGQSRGLETVGGHLFYKHFVLISVVNILLFSELLIHSLPSEGEEEGKEGSNAMDERTQYNLLNWLHICALRVFPMLQVQPKC